MQSLFSNFLKCAAGFCFWLSPETQTLFSRSTSAAGQRGFLFLCAGRITHTHTVSLYINLMGLELKPCVCSWISGAALLRHDDLHRSASPFASVFVPQIADVTCCGEVLPLYALLNSLLCLKILHVFILSHSAHDSGLRPCSNLSLPFYYYDACCTYGRADRR